MSNRRDFLKFLAGSPLLGALPAGLPAFAQALAQTATSSSRIPPRR